MQAQVQEYEDALSGARHTHLATDDEEMIFLVAFPTLPDVSDGRAHILEHLALCGSQRYPVRDPFFSMLRRSTAHFMNAMTYPDKTVYPFASTDKTDFFNLMDVYLDAAFFPNLDYYDFLQEGWRLGFEDGKLSYHGIVFNEMKGAFADPLRALDKTICSHLFAGTTYAVESGGDPLVIPSLTYDALKEFHATHYHPAQAVFMTAGKVDPIEVQAIIQERVLSKISLQRAERKLPQLASTWTAPKAVTINTPSQEYGVQISWLQGESIDPRAYFHAELLEAGLLSNSAAPLMRAMESAGYGRPASLNGSDAGFRQMIFHLGMEGLTEAQVPKARQHLWSALETAAKEGVPQGVLQATLRDIRFTQREVRSGSTPYLLKRLLRALPHEMYGGDIINGLDKEAILAELQQEIADPAFFKGLVRKLLDSSTRLDSTIVPDAEYFQKRKKIEEDRLAELEKSLSADEKERLQTEAATLLERQRKPVNNDILPRIRPQDVNPAPLPVFAIAPNNNGNIAAKIPSNGISYLRVMYEVTDMDQVEWPWLQLYVDVLPGLGVGNKTYEEADAWRHSCVPSFNVNLDVVQRQEQSKPMKVRVDFYVKGLREENETLANVLSESIRNARFDEGERVAFLIDSMVQDIRNDLAEDGNRYAKVLASASVSPIRYFENCISGTEVLKFYRTLHQQSQTKDGLDEICGKLTELHRKVIARVPEISAAGMENDAQTLIDLLNLPAPTHTVPVSAAVVQGNWPLSKAALHAPGQVNHCHAIWDAPSLGHPDAAALSVLGEILTNLFLHQALREEGGAYGANAGYSSTNGTFIMASYRDPRLASTYESFAKAITWVMDAELKQENVEEAIICVIQSVDRPRTPYAKVMLSWEMQHQGITDEMRRRYRSGVLNCTADQIKAAAATWLLNKPYSRAAFVGNADQDLGGLEVVNLASLIN